MTELLAELALTAFAFLLAGWVKGVIGMGLPTVAIGVLSLAMPPGKAAALLLAPSLVTNAWQIWAGGRVRPILRRLWPLLLGTCVGTGTGALLFAPGSTGRGDLTLGAALIVYAGLGLGSVPMRVRPGDEGWLGPVAGFATGLITVASNVFVIPNVPYLGALRWSRDEFVQALGVSFTVSTLALGAALIAHRVLVPSLAGASLLAILPAIVGMYLGQVVRARVSLRVFRLCFFLGLVALGGHLVLRGLA